MRKTIVASLFVMLPIVGTAAPTTANESSPGYSVTDIMLISAGMVAGAVLVDFILAQTLTAPTTATVSSTAVAEASAAGAVFGDKIAAATMIKDTKARADMLYALIVGSGAVLGAVALDHIWNWANPINLKTAAK